MDASKKNMIKPDDLANNSNPNLLENPNSIFKYKPININTLSVILNSSLWFGQLNTQNDPFEGVFIINNISKTINESNVNLLLEFIDSKFNEEINTTEKYSDAFYKKLVYAYQETVKLNVNQTFGICSFSKNYDNQLLWSLYANSHMGVCLIFDKVALLNDLKEEEPLMNFVEIEYKPQVPKFDFDFSLITDLLIDPIDTLKRKHIDFMGEDEIRFINYDYSSYMTDSINSHLEKIGDPYRKKYKIKKNRNLKFSSNAFKGIILGLDISDSDELTLKNLIKNSKEFSNIEIYKTVMSPSTKRIVVNRYWWIK